MQGPDEDKIKLILDRTGYSLDVTTGQRKYGGPPPGWDGPSPGNGCEVSSKALTRYGSANQGCGSRFESGPFFAGQ